MLAIKSPIDFYRLVLCWRTAEVALAIVAVAACEHFS